MSETKRYNRAAFLIEGILTTDTLNAAEGKMYIKSIETNLKNICNANQIKFAKKRMHSDIISSIYKSRNQTLDNNSVLNLQNSTQEYFNIAQLCDKYKVGFPEFKKYIFEIYDKIGDNRSAAEELEFESFVRTYKRFEPLQNQIGKIYDYGLKNGILTYEKWGKIDQFELT